MTIALLGVDIVVIVALVGAILAHRRSVKGRRGSFKGKLRVAEGELDGFSAKWTSGYGYWVRDVLVWNRTPFLFPTRLIGVDGTDASGIHPAINGELKGLGKRALVAPLLAGRRSRLELATSDEDRELALGPFARTSAVGSLVRARFPTGDLYDPDDN
jgi:hypothetical protein